MRRNATLHFGFDCIADDGTPVPNGVPPLIWNKRAEVDLENPIPEVHFRESVLLHYAAQSGVEVVCDTAEELAATNVSWFYLLRPYAVPDLTPALSGLREPVREAIDEGRCQILIDYSGEGYSQWMFIRVYDALQGVDIPAKGVILLSGDFGVRAGHEACIAKRGTLEPIAVHPFNWFRARAAEVGARLSMAGALPDWNDAASRLDRPYLYLNFNRRNRCHRILTVSRLLQKGILNRGLVSLESEFEGRTNEETYEDEAGRFGLSESMLSELRRDYPELKAILPLHIDVNEMTTNHAHTYLTWPYQKTWLSLVSETLFFESFPNQVFLSEKVFKPMLYFHPFLLIGDSGSLGALRDMGFRSFHPHIDESYDGERNHDRRLEMVLDELQRVSLMSRTALARWYLDMSESLQHNRESVRVTDLEGAFGFLGAATDGCDIRC